MVITSPPIEAWRPSEPPRLSFFETGKGPQGPNQIDWKGEEIECGNIKGKLTCKDGHQTNLYSYCYRQECPVCWPVWLKRQLKGVRRRFEFVLSSTNLSQRHVMVSYHYLPATKTALSKARKEAIVAARFVGIEGGLIVSHYHQRKDGTEGIHFHVQGVGTVDKAKVVAWYRRTGTVIKDIAGVSNANSLANYELDHAIKVQGVHTVSWFGIFHSYFLKVEKQEIEQERLCTHKGDDKRLCGKVLYEERTVCHWDGGSTKNPPAKETIVEYHHEWRRKPII